MLEKFYWFFITLLVSILHSQVFALDNPDSTNHVKTLQISEKPYLIKINNSANSTRDTIRAYHDYKVFLDSELNKAYKLLMKNLPDEYKNDLKDSQRQWMKFRDAEFKLINNNWDRKNFGSSFAISRGQYSSKIIRNRVVQLYRYAQNY